MELIRDMLYVKSLERRLRRRLTDEEMNGETFRAIFPDGRVEFLAVPLIRFPHDLITRPEDMVSSIWEEMETHFYMGSYESGNQDY